MSGDRWLSMGDALMLVVLFWLAAVIAWWAL